MRTLSLLTRASVRALAVLALLGAALARADGPALMPLPRSGAYSEERLHLTGPFAARWSSCRSAALDRALRRLQADVARRTGVGLEDATGVALTISCKSNTPLSHDRDEGYRLVVERSGVRIEAEGAAGVLRAFATLRQLVTLRGGRAEIELATIEDAPRFAWRGVLLDIARHFLSVETLERQIDAMERVKLNVLHLHLSDDEGFRVESRRYPRLNSVSSHGEYYTQGEVRRLVAYAADRGVLIVPEFDVPGHSRALVDAYPDIGLRAASATPPFPPGVALNPARPQTYKFLHGLINEMASLFPGPYFHVGGDEVSAAAWEGSADVKALMVREKLTSKHEVEGYFARRVAQIVRGAGKTPIGWEEVTEADAGADVVIQAWQTSNATAAATAKGHRTVVSAGYYLDLLMPTDFHYAKDPLSTSAAGFTPQEAEDARKVHPLVAKVLTDALVAKPLSPLTPEQEKLVLGGEAPLWGELVTDEMVDHRLWPRAAALAERFWSPATVRDTADMYRRLSIVHDQLTVSGLAGDAQRRRMMLRLVRDAAPVETLLEIVTPVRNMAHDHRIRAALRGQRIVQSLNALADAAPADSLLAQRFTLDARRYVAGERDLNAPLRAQLTLWRDNDARFAAVARGNAMLEPALPTSANIASLAQLGLAAIDAIEAGRVLDETMMKGTADVLAQAEKDDAASRKPLLSFLQTQQPADLIIAFTPGIRALVDAATSVPHVSAEDSSKRPAVGMVQQACMPLPTPPPAAVSEFNEVFLEPGKPNLLRMLALARDPHFIAYNAAKKEREAKDWAGLCRYQEENRALIAAGRRPDVVFMGDSITENWVRADPELFAGKVIGRGISGQTSGQMLVRFHADVVALRPRVVHIMAGTNDVAGNAGPTTERAYQDNIMAMVEIARAHGVRVVLASIPPAARFPWRAEVKPAAQIGRLNAWLRDYAARERLAHVDYYSSLATPEGALKPDFGFDGVHPNRDGYAAMREVWLERAGKAP